jgi:putative inorganic carbon (HCO3(-)) transporter
MHLDTSHIRLLGKLFLVLSLAVISAAGTIVLFESSPKIFVLIVGGIGLILSLSLSGNPRLFCFWGLFITAPINMDISFFAIPHMGGAGAYTIDLVDLFLAPMLFFQLRDFARGYRHEVRFSNVTVFWGALIILGLFDVITGPLRHVPAHEVFRMLKLLLLFLIIINEVVRVRQIKNIVIALMIGVALQSLIGLSQYFFDANLGATILGEAPQAQVEFTSRATYQTGEFTRRIGALFGHPNLLAIYLAMMLPIAITTLFTRISPPYKFMMGAIIVMGLVVLVLTLSRSGWISFAVAFITIMSLSFVNPKVRHKFIFIKVAMLVSVVTVAVGLSGPILKRLFESGGGAVDFRWEWMAVSWEMIKTEPFLGFGLNTFVFRMPEFTDYGTAGGVMENFATSLPVVHNIYLLVWVEQGTIGLIFYLALNAYLMVLGWRNTKYNNNDLLHMVNIGCMAAIMAHAVDGMASFFLRNPGPGRIYFIVAALIVAIHYWNRENAHLYKSA